MQSKVSPKGEEKGYQGWKVRVYRTARKNRPGWSVNVEGMDGSPYRKGRPREL